MTIVYASAWIVRRRWPAAVALLCSSCIIGNYGGKHYVGTPTSTLEGDTRQVTVGARHALAIDPTDPDLTVRVTGIPLCRAALFGDDVERQEYRRHRRTALAGLEVAVGAIGWIVGMSMFMVGSGDSQSTLDPATGAEIALPSLYLGVLGGERLVQDDRKSGTDVVARHPGASEWRGDVVDCDAPAPAAPGTHPLRIVMTFAASPAISATWSPTPPGSSSCRATWHKPLRSRPRAATRRSRSPTSPRVAGVAGTIPDVVVP